MKSPNYVIATLLAVICVGGSSPSLSQQSPSAFDMSLLLKPIRARPLDETIGHSRLLEPICARLLELIMDWTRSLTVRHVVW
jgi:hypothetical protein